MKAPGEIAPSAFSALILSAGRSSRMEEFKPLLPLGGETLFERVIRLFRQAGIDDVTAVLGHRAESLIPLVERCGVRSVINERYDEGMFSSLRAGVLALDPGRRGFFLLPVDIPLVRPETLRALMAAFRAGTADVCRPCFRGRYGHPPLIATELIPAIAGFDGAGGLRTLLDGWQGRTAAVAVEDPGILVDVDTRDDYERLRMNLEGG
ncbi:MAG: nucleotidyltransferase family protein [Syntrophales bacterium]